MERTIGPQLTVNSARAYSSGAWGTTLQQRLQNATFAGSGAGGVGDRGAWQSIPQYSGNPYDSNDYVYRWRQYVHMYELSWEARKIIRIPVEDALRKEWIAEGIPEKMSLGIQQKLRRMNFLHVLSRSLMLERLLGGCLTFMGLDSTEDNALRPYKPTDGSILRFCNAIPISRISRMSWDTNPLSEHYMRPDRYLVNGEGLHVSRCLVWDGEPLFDPYDFALTNFRSNLAGFGPSKLAPIWDDIVKATGTREAAYQLIQTNNAIIAAITGLQDLAGAKGGQTAVNKLKELVNSISVYRAALVDGDRVSITQSAASFGSVPELIITFIQVLSAASDIPATRFIGQAPGGLNATGQSDLENYYNMIDSFQIQRIDPALRRVYDILGYSMYTDWKIEREKLTFKFPPLWNLTEIQEGERAAKVIENVMKARDGNLISDEKIIEELNHKEVFSVKLDNTDIQNIDDTGLGLLPGNNRPPVPPTPGSPQTPPGDGGTKTAGNATEDKGGGGEAGGPQSPPNPEGQIQRLRQSKPHYFRNADSLGLLIKAAGGDPDRIDREQFARGLAEEQEHFSTTRGDEVQMAKIALDHLAKDPEYYVKLRQYVENDTAAFTENEERVFSKLYPQASGVVKDAWLCGYYGRMARYPKDTVAWEWYEKGREYRRTGVQNSIFLPHHHPDPSEAQRHAGNYKKHHVRLHGLDFSIENPWGSERSGITKDGQKWTSILPAHYGYVRKTVGADGDHVDAYIGLHEDSELVFVVDQNDVDSGTFDEHKCIFGALSMTQAKDLYLKGFSDGKGVHRIGAITPMTIDGFKQWLQEGDTTRPFVNTDPKFEEEHPRGSGTKGGQFVKKGEGSGGGATMERTKKPGVKEDAPKEKAADEKFREAMKDKSPADVKAFTAARERGIAVPPAWSNVWVNPDKNADLMVKGKDTKGRPTYMYSASHKNKQDAQKFNRLKAFTKSYDHIVGMIERDMDVEDEAKVLYLIAKTGFRIGGLADTGAEEKAYGASTLKGTHVAVKDGKAVFDFVGKKGVQQNHEVDDPKIVEMVKGKVGKDVPLFTTTPEKVRDKLKSYAPKFVVKDFRTYVATDVALGEIAQIKEKPKTERELQKAILLVASAVSQKLGNSPTMARDSYIDPTVFKPWKEAIQQHA